MLYSPINNEIKPKIKANSKNGANNNSTKDLISVSKLSVSPKIPPKKKNNPIISGRGSIRVKLKSIKTTLNVCKIKKPSNRYPTLILGVTFSLSS